MRDTINRPCTAILFAVLLAASATAGEPVFDYLDIVHPETARHGMVAAQHRLASEVGAEVLRAGGNAIDAAVTVGFALAVVLPRAGNIGGGGFMLVRTADGEAVALDFRETAPRRAHRDMYLDETGEVSIELARYSHLSAGVPGTVAGLALALERWGTIDLRDAIAPAIRFAEEGFTVDRALHQSLAYHQERMSASPASLDAFYPGGAPPEIGSTLTQPDLAWSLRQIRDGGVDAFYRGPLAERIAADMAAHGGMIDMQDLDAYRPVQREPLYGEYRDHEIVAFPPPSSGGVMILHMLQMLEPVDLAGLGHNSAAYIHVLAETMRRAYADRAVHLGDPDFVDVPVAGLLDRDYIKARRETIDLGRATPSAEVAAGIPIPKPESDETTQISVIDAMGNAVSCTYTLNSSYGSKRVIAGTGILLNNEMDDFSSKPGSPNAYGLVGDEANAIAPGKRMLSSMSPTIVVKDGRPRLVTGSPGGSRIISATLQILLNVIDHGMNVAAASAAVRVHHQWLPDELRVERGLSPDTVRLLEAMGHAVVVKYSMGGTQTIEWRDGVFRGACDPRRPGAGAVGY